MLLAMPDGDRQRFRPSPNVAPTSSLPVLSSSRPSNAPAPSLSIELMRWGVQTSSPSLPLLINARSETAPSLARFARMLSSPSGRGVVAADGYYEWEARSKQPYFVRRSDGEPMLLAALVAREGEEGEGGNGGGRPRGPPCFVILTRAPPKKLRWLHDRCPCILPSEELAREWLLGAPGSSSDAPAAARRDPATEASDLLSRAGAAVEASFAEKEKSTTSSPSPPLLSWHPVTKEVGKTSYQRWDASKDVRLGGIASLFGKAKEASAAVKNESPSPLLPSSGAKRKEERDASNEKHPAKRARPAAVAAATTAKKTPGKGQRSLDFFLSPKKEEEKK